MATIVQRGGDPRGAILGEALGQGLSKALEKSASMQKVEKLAEVMKNVELHGDPEGLVNALLSSGAIETPQEAMGALNLGLRLRESMAERAFRSNERRERTKSEFELAKLRIQAREDLMEKDQTFQFSENRLREAFQGRENQRNRALQQASINSRELIAQLDRESREGIALERSGTQIQIAAMNNEADLIAAQAKGGGSDTDKAINNLLQLWRVPEDKLPEGKEAARAYIKDRGKLQESLMASYARRFGKDFDQLLESERKDFNEAMQIGEFLMSHPGGGLGFAAAANKAFQQVEGFRAGQEAKEDETPEIPRAAPLIIDATS